MILRSAIIYYMRQIQQVSGLQVMDQDIQKGLQKISTSIIINFIKLALTLVLIGQGA